MAISSEILKGKYPAKDHARRVAEYIVKHGGDSAGIIYLEAQKTKIIEVFPACQYVYRLS